MNNYDFLDYYETIKIDKKHKNSIILDKNGNINIYFDNEFIKDNTSENIEILRKSIINFLNVLRKECKSFDPTIFVNNFKRTIFELGKENDNRKGFVKISKPNKFFLETFDVVNHELLHLAGIKKNFFGMLLYTYDESYTQLIAERYFDENVKKVYPNSVEVIKKIENILGKDLMEEKFFKGKLFSTFKYLYKYETKENIDKLLLYLTKIHSLEGYSNSEEKIKKYMELTDEIINSILNNKEKKINR